MKLFYKSFLYYQQKSKPLNIVSVLYRFFSNPFRVVLGPAYRGLTGGILLLRNFSVAISVSNHVCFILVLILFSMFLR